MIRSRCACTITLPATTKPLFGARAKATMERSSSPASRTLIGLTSTPAEADAVWSAPNCPLAAATAASPKECHARHAGGDFLEQLQRFPADAVLENLEAGDIAARPRQAIHEAGADRIRHMSRTRLARYELPAATLLASRC